MAVVETTWYPNFHLFKVFQGWKFTADERSFCLRVLGGARLFNVVIPYDS